MKWEEVKIILDPSDLDQMTYILYDIDFGGFEIYDGLIDEEDMKNMFVDIFEAEEILKDKDTYLKVYIPEENNPKEKIQVLKAMIESTEFQMPDKINLVIEEKDEEDWANNWKKFYKPFYIGNILIRPIWETQQPLEGDILIEIEPGMAFGSGTHETTSMCVSLIQKYLKPEDHLIDVGCGSGILGIVGAKLGAQQVTCIDIDAAAIKVCKENIGFNHVESCVTAVQGNLIETVETQYDIAVANILADVIMMLTQDIGKVLKQSGIFITSGIITEKAEAVIEVLEANHFEIIERVDLNKWVAIVAKHN